MHILLVEDDDYIRGQIKLGLLAKNYQVTEAADGEVALELFAAGQFQLVLLDIMLPKVSGDYIMKQIRGASDVPILIISALDDELFQVEAFKQKVDDYVVKPFSIDVLMYKIGALLRRVYGDEVKKINYQELVLYPDNCETFFQGEKVNLTTKEFELLQVLLSNRGRVFSREDLITLVWGYDYYGDERNVDVHVKNIRKKTSNEIIKTVKGVGYKIEKNE